MRAVAQDGSLVPLKDFLIVLLVMFECGVSRDEGCTLAITVYLPEC